MTARNILVSILNIIVGVVTFFLGLRIVFRLFAANPNTPFVSWVYDVSGALLAPFRGIFPNPTIGQNAVFDIPAFVALVVYAIVAYIAIALIDASLRVIDHGHTQHHAHV